MPLPYLVIQNKMPLPVVHGGRGVGVSAHRLARTVAGPGTAHRRDCVAAFECRQCGLRDDAAIAFARDTGAQRLAHANVPVTVYR